MITYAQTARFGAAIGLGLLAAACSGNGSPPRSTTARAQPVPATEAEAIAGLLERGDERAAKKRLAAALKKDPGNANLMVLRDSIERDPKELLGPNSYAYTVQAGDTIGGLAQRFLGNRLKAHQLARYNGILGAAVLGAGQTLRIPGEPPRIEPVRRPDRRVEPQATPARPKATPTRPAVAAPPAGAVNVTAARQARAAGLAALNDGNPARAVSLLSRAASLDPGNAVIARDLARARRINATVRASQ